MATKFQPYQVDPIIDLLIADPTVTPAELAEVFGISRLKINKMLASDMLQKRFTDRRREIVNPVIIQSMTERMMALSLHASSVIQERLTVASAKEATDILNVATAAMGMQDAKVKK